jgi:chromosome segregation ATPase
MVELTLIFFLGVLTAGLLGVLLLPFIWARARRLTRQQLERALPLDANEILAERDRDRAVFAVKVLAAEQRLEALQNSVLAARREVGDGVAREAGLLDQMKHLQGESRTVQTALDKAQAELAVRHQRIETIEAQLTEARGQLSRLEQAQQMLDARLAQAQEHLESERRIKGDLAVRLSSAQAAEAEERARVSALRHELQERAHRAREAARVPASES